MNRKITLLILGLLFLIVIESNGQYKNYSIPNYLKPTYSYYYLNNPDNPSIFTRKVKYTPVPPEVAKYIPEQTRIQTADGFELINISPGNNAQSETWIAINPTNPSNIIATSNDNYYLGGYDNWRMSAWASFDGGLTWTHQTTPANRGVYIDPPPKGSMTIFDPGVAFDANGNALYTYGYSQINTNSEGSEINGVFGALSTNGGASWDGYGNDIPVTAIALSAYEPGNPFHDRFSVAADNNPNSPYKNRFYVSWQRFRVNQGAVFAYSTDGGLNWIGPTLIGTGNTQAPLPAVGPDGEVYVAWINTNYPNEAQAFVRKSTNGGQNWGPSVIAQSVVSIGTRHPQSNRFVLTDKQSIRVSSAPQIAVDNSNKSTRGWVYVVQAGRDVPNGSNRVYVARSTDKGQTWQNKIRVDDNEVGNDLFFPSICVDPITGTVAVLYYSSQNDPENNQGVDAYLSISKDGGNTWKVIRITPTTAYLNSLKTVSDQSFGLGVGGGNLYWGDYTSVAAYNGVIYPLFWMPSLPTGDFGSLDLFTAPISQKIKPVTNLTAKSLYVDNQIKIQLDWKNPETDMFNEPVDNFEVLIKRNDKPSTTIAAIPNNLPPTYTDVDVIDGTWYTYELTVRANDGRESVPVSVSVLAGGTLKPLPPQDITWRPKEDGVQLTWRNPEFAIDGSTIRELSGVKILLNGEVVKIVPLSQIQAGEIVSELIPMDAKTFAKVRLISIATRGEASAESDTTNELLVYAGPIYTSLNETFDDEANSIPRYSEKGWEITSIVASTPPNSIATTPTEEEYEKNTIYTMYLAPVVLGDTSNTLSFDNMSLIHRTDYGELAMSTDWGKTWICLNWYTILSSENFVPRNPQMSQWKNEVKDMRPYVGDTVLYRFSLISDKGFGDRGWFVDNIRLDTRFDIYEAGNFSSNSVNIAPNPVENIAHVSMTLLQPGNVSYRLYNSLGKSEIKADLGYTSNPFYSFDVETSNLASGMYFLQIQVGSSTITKPIIITK